MIVSTHSKSLFAISLIASTMLGAMATGCAAPVADAEGEQSADGSELAVTPINIQPGLFKLYSSPSARPNPGCDVHTNLVIAGVGNTKTASLIDVVSGVCELAVVPNPRSYVLKAKDVGCGSFKYIGTAITGAKTGSIEISDNRFRLCDNSIGASIETREFNKGKLIGKLFALSNAR
jgi:hypothetical protein